MAFNNAINATATGLLTASSSGVITGNTTTQYNVLTGGASNAINNIAPNSTSGVPLISQGASSQPVFGTAVVAGGGTGITSGTAYGVVVGGTTTTGALQVITPGSAGTVLQYNGASSLPTWVTAPSGGTNYLVLISSQTASASSSLTFTSGISATYNDYFILMSSIKLSASNPLQMQISTNGGSSYITTGYLTGVNSIASTAASGSWSNAVNATTYLVAVYSNGSSYYLNSNIYLYNATAGSGFVCSQSSGMTGDMSTVNKFTFGQGVYTTTSTTVNALKFVPSSGTFSGTITLFGILE